MTPWLLLLLAALAMVLRAPIYVVEPSFWAEEGTLYFAVAWEHPLREALTYRPAGYLLLWANLATTAAARLVRTGLLPLAHAPQVTVLFALLPQLAPVAVIAWSRTPFWGGTLRRAVGIAILLFGVLTDEIWLNTVNSQPWLVLAATLLLLEPAASGSARSWAVAGILAVAGLSAPATSALAPLFVWRAWRTRTGPALVQAAVVVGGGLVQAWCVWAAVRSGEPLAARMAGIEPGIFAATVWMRMLVLPLLGVGAAEEVARLVGRGSAVGPVGGVLLLALAGVLVTWLARGLRPPDRLPLAGSYALITTLTLLTTVGDKAMLLYSPWVSSRYAYVPGVLLLLMLLGSVHGVAGWARPALCALVLGVRLGQGMAHFPTSVLWKPEWPRWPNEVQAWAADSKLPLAIWPPPWTLTLPRRGHTSVGHSQNAADVAKRNQLSSSSHVIVGMFVPTPALTSCRDSARVHGAGRKVASARPARA